MTPTMTTAFETLPAPLKRKIFSHVPLQDLPTCRLISSNISEFATERVFESVKLKVDYRSAQVFQEIARSDRLRRYVREVNVDTVLENGEYVCLLLPPSFRQKI